MVALIMWAGSSHAKVFKGLQGDMVHQFSSEMFIFHCLAFAFGVLSG